MNKVGILYAYWSRDWNVDFHPYIDKAADLGFENMPIKGILTCVTSLA